jgi:MFS family permease
MNWYRGPGTFWPIMGRYLRDGLGFDAGDVGRIYATLAVGAMVSPMIVGPLADRYFAADRMLAALHLGAALLLVVPAQFEPGTELAGLSGPGLYWWAMLAFALVFQPTWVLAYSVCFRHLPDARRDMPGIRVIGTVGWVVAGLLIGPLLGEGAEATGRPLLMGAAFAGALGPGVGGPQQAGEFRPPNRVVQHEVGHGLADLREVATAAVGLQGVGDHVVDDLFLGLAGGTGGPHHLAQPAEHRRGGAGHPGRRLRPRGTAYRRGLPGPPGFGGSLDPVGALPRPESTRPADPVDAHATPLAAKPRPGRDLRTHRPRPEC